MQQHWEKVYRSKAPHQVSWFRPHLEISLAMIERAAQGDRHACIMDVGGGASTLVDDLWKEGYRNITVLDLSQTALDIAKARLAACGEHVRWVCGNLLDCPLPNHSIDIWHDRAVFHFLTDPADRISYVRRVRETVRPRGHVILATFGAEGPIRCSGLDTCRYDAASLKAQFGEEFELIESALDMHQMPVGGTQHFQYCHCVLRG